MAWEWGNKVFTNVYDNLAAAAKNGEKVISDYATSAKNGVVGSVQWIWEALQGDFNQDRTVAQIAADAVLGVVPIIDQVLDVRDIIANSMHINDAGEDKDKKSAAWLALGLTLVGLIPSLGSIAKGILKIILLMARKFGGDIGKALKPALVPIKMFLTDPKVRKILGGLSYPEFLLAAAKKFKAVKGLANVSTLTGKFADAVNSLKSIIGKVKYVAPKNVVTWLDQSLKVVEKIQKQADVMLASALKPIQKIIDDIVAFLEKEAKDAAPKATTNTKTAHRSASAVAGIDPKILTRTKKGLYGEIISDEFMTAKGHTQLLAQGRYVRSLSDVPKGRGIDGVYLNASPPPKYIITETKYRTTVDGKTVYVDSNGDMSPSLLGKASYGKQMSDDWIEFHARSEFASNPAVINEIVKKKDYLPVLMLVDETGKVTAMNVVTASGGIGRAISPSGAIK